MKARVITRVRRGVALAGLASGTWSSLSVVYLLVLLIAATLRRPRPVIGAGGELRLIVLIPAHDEEPVIAAAVRALVDGDYPQSRRRVIVIADNCTDATARVAAAAGAEVWERNDPARPGKGQALAWAIARLDGAQIDGLVMVDADCRASPNLLGELADGLATGADAVQAAYVVANPEASSATALRFAGYALINTLRPLAKSRLGLSAGILGSGMALSPRALGAVPWDAFSITEDREYHLRLLLAGLSVRFAPDASVSSDMPVTDAGGRAQQMRWDTGNVELARRFVGPLVRCGIRTGSVDAAHGAFELLVPAQSVIAATAGTAFVLGAAGGSARSRRLGLGALAGQAGFVLGGLAVVRAPSAVFRALGQAPRLIVRRVGQNAAIVAGRGSRSWERTAR